MNTEYVSTEDREALASSLQEALSKAQPRVVQFAVPYALAAGALYAIFATLSYRIHPGLGALFALSWFVQMALATLGLLLVAYAPARWLAYRSLLGRLAQWESKLAPAQLRWLQVQLTSSSP